MRSGNAYVADLRDGRSVYLDGERVGDVTKHPAFAEPIRRIAETCDRARSDDALDVTSYRDPATGERYGAMRLVPRSAADLEARRRVHRFWARGLLRAHGAHAGPRRVRAHPSRARGTASPAAAPASATTSSGSTRSRAPRTST